MGTTRTSVTEIKSAVRQAYRNERELGLSHSEAVASASNGNATCAVEEWVETIRKAFEAEEAELAEAARDLRTVTVEVCTVGDLEVGDLWRKSYGDTALSEVLSTRREQRHGVTYVVIDYSTIVGRGSGCFRVDLVAERKPRAALVEAGGMSTSDGLGA